MAIEKSAAPFLLASGASVVMGAFGLMLPHTPPAATGSAFNARRALGLDALVMLRPVPFFVFAIASVLACVPLTFYFSFTNDYHERLLERRTLDLIINADTAVSEVPNAAPC